MRRQFRTKKLEALYADPDYVHHYPEAVVTAFDEVMATIDAARDERDLFNLRGLHLEKLRGKRGKEGQWSIRLNRQYRLIVVFEEDVRGKYLLIHSITDHYR